MSTNPPKSRFELFVDLVKASAWPLLGAVVLISFWGPLRSASEQLPHILSRSETITIAGLSLKISKSLSKQPSEEVKRVLSNLSPQSIRSLLNMSGSIFWDIGSEPSAKADYAELLKLGLVEEASANELRSTEKGKRYGYGVRISSLGRETQNFLFEIVSEFVQELERAGNQEK